MNKLIPKLLSVAALTLPIAALADSRGYDGYGRRDPYGAGYDGGPYVGIGIGQIRYDEEGLDTITPGAFTARLGAQLSPNLAVEGRVGGGFGRSETNSYGVELTSMYGGYLKGILPLSPYFSVYALGGVTGVNLRRDFGDDTAHETGFSYGAGMDFSLPLGAVLNVEYTRLANGSNQGYDYNVDMASVGLAWRF